MDDLSRLLAPVVLLDDLPAHAQPQAGAAVTIGSVDGAAENGGDLED